MPNNRLATPHSNPWNAGKLALLAFLLIRYVHKLKIVAKF